MCRGRRQRTCLVGRDPCVPPQHTHYSRRGTRAPPYRVRRSYRADRVVRPYFLSFRASPRREASALGVQTGVGIRIPARRCRAVGTPRTLSTTKNACCRGGDGGAMWASPRRNGTGHAHAGGQSRPPPLQRKKRRLPPSLFIQLYCRTTAVTLPSRVA